MKYNRYDWGEQKQLSNKDLKDEIIGNDNIIRSMQNMERKGKLSDEEQEFKDELIQEQNELISEKFSRN